MLHNFFYIKESGKNGRMFHKQVFNSQRLVSMFVIYLRGREEHLTMPQYIGGLMTLPTNVRLALRHIALDKQSILF